MAKARWPGGDTLISYRGPMREATAGDNKRLTYEARPKAGVEGLPKKACKRNVCPVIKRANCVASGFN